MIAEEGGGNLALAGYCLVAVGAADLLAAVMLLLVGKPANPKVRQVLVAALGLSGMGMIVVGILLWMGVLGGG